MRVIVEKDINDYLEIYFSLLLPLLTFFLGYILSDKVSRNKEKRRLLRTYTYFVHYYSDQIVAIQKQINSIKKLLESVKQMTHVMSLNLELVNQPYFILDSINKSELFDVWCNVKKYDPNEYINLLKSIQYFKSSFENHKNYYNGFLPRQNDLRIKWNLAIKGVHELYASLILLPEWKSNPNLKFFNETYRSWGANEPDEISYKYTVDKIVEPLTNYFNGVIAKNEQDRELGVKIIFTIAPINHVFIEWTNEVADYDKFLSELIQRLETELSKMKPKLPN